MDHKELEDNYMEHQQAVFGGGSFEMADYMLNTPPAPLQQQNSLDRLSFAEVLQFADFRPKLSPGVGQAMRVPGGDDVESCFFRFPPSLPSPPALPPPLLPQQHHRLHDAEEAEKLREIRELEEEEEEEEEELARFSENTASSVQQSDFGFGGDGVQGMEGKSRRKRPRSMKTSEEVESQRMTHIAVERNRRRQMNDHLRVLRSLMPSSYVQRGDQASIIGGAIEFVRELEQLLQCLESQKRRRLYGNGTDASLPLSMQQQQPPPPPPFCLDTPGGGELREDMAENKSCLADVEVRLLGLDAMIKILSRRRPGQLLKTIAALEDMQLSILHTNITTVEQTVLYSFNVKITEEARCAAEEIADSVQQILGFIDSSALSSDQY